MEETLLEGMVSTASFAFTLVMLIFYLVCLVLWFVIAVKGLKKAGFSGWNSLLFLIPLLIYL